MKARPILFSTPMVRALLDGGKTQTRRIVKNVSSEDYPIICGSDDRDGKFVVTFADAPYPEVISRIEAPCPYGITGDLLWVRESVWIPPYITNKMLRDGADTWADCLYVTDEDEYERNWCLEHDWKKKPSIHMQRRLSRLTLEITEARVQRLQDISEDDAQAEGASAEYYRTQPENNISYAGHSYILGYRNIWEKINGKDSWAANPWVWAITFKTHCKNIGEFV